MALGALVLGAYSLTSEERDHVIDSVAHDISQTLLSQPQSLLQLPQQKSELIEQVCGRMKENRYRYVCCELHMCVHTKLT